MMKRVAEMKARPYPVNIAVVDNEAALKRFCKRKGMPYIDPDGGYAVTISMESETAFWVLMVFPENMQDDEDVCPASVIAHECMHAVQNTFEYVGERKPSHEAQAYLLDSFVKFCMKSLGYKTVKDVKEEKQKIGFHIPEPEY
jgi:hypothetical protein